MPTSSSSIRDDKKGERMRREKKRKRRKGEERKVKLNEKRGRKVINQCFYLTQINGQSVDLFFLLSLSILILFFSFFSCQKIYLEEKNSPVDPFLNET